MNFSLSTTDGVRASSYATSISATGRRRATAAAGAANLTELRSVVRGRRPTTRATAVLPGTPSFGAYCEDAYSSSRRLL